MKEKKMIDKKPAPGRIVVNASRYAGRFFIDGGKISKVSGTRVYYTDAQGVKTYTVNFAAICDTEAEESGLFKFQNDCTQETHNIRQNHAAAFQKILKTGKVSKRLSANLAALEDEKTSDSEPE